MKLRFNKILSVLFAAAFLSAQWIPVNADKLAVGSVEGLPEKLVVLDDKGNSVSDNGEYFFQVENMKAGETYTKKIQIMNLREDATYAIYFNAQPLTKSGEIDLEEECKCNIYMNDKTVYYGKITGEGTPDMRDTPLNLGLYEPGDSRVLTVEIRWNPADHGGLTVALEAFKEVCDDEVKLGFTPLQRFFIAYACTWAENCRDEMILQQTKSDEHSLSRLRVNGALPHIDEWYSAFGITEEDSMYIAPQNRVRIW